MAQWDVTVPVTGTATITVEADTEAEAVQKALCEGCDWQLDEWEVHEQVEEGNILYGQLGRAFAEIVKE